MRSQTYRENVMSHLRGVMLGCVPFLLSAGTSLACNNSSLNGVYPFTASGFTVGIYDSAGVLQYLNPAEPLSSVGQYTFDGHGNFTRVDFPRRSMSQAFGRARSVHIQSARTALAK
jgi:hypothetical protein